MKLKYFVLGDIHSFHYAMMTALNEKGFDINDPSHHVVVCGDLFDRGPDAVKVFEFAKELANQGRFYYVCGNHETLLNDLVTDIKKGRGIYEHHITNGTLDTVLQFTGLNYYDLRSGVTSAKEFGEKIAPLMNFIYDNVVDYVEIGDYILTHGWIPCNPNTGEVAENWRDDINGWEQARWYNGISAWHKGARVPGKTIVCGHWHCSWGWSHLRLERKEFPKKNLVDWQKSFEPFVDDGIVAIDACTAYSGICNCFVIEV